MMIPIISRVIQFLFLCVSLYSITSFQQNRIVKRFITMTQTSTKSKSLISTTISKIKKKDDGIFNKKFKKDQVNMKKLKVNPIGNGITSKKSKEKDTSKQWKINEKVSWRIFNIEVLYENDPGKSFLGLHEQLMNSTIRAIGLHKKLAFIPEKYLDSDNTTMSSDVQLMSEIDKQRIREVLQNFKIIRKSFDGRWKKFGQPKFVYTIEITITGELSHLLYLKHNEGQIEFLNQLNIEDRYDAETIRSPKVVIIGSGPAGLFSALEMCKYGIKPIIIERGQPVEIRGRDIGALINRKDLKENSNLCFGEGGAGTWSDGKLTTRIGKNSQDVRSVLQTLVDYGGPSRILVDGKPHLGTDNLVKILKNMRLDLKERGVAIHFDTTVVDIATKNNQIIGVVLANGEIIDCDTCILATGHSSRKMYEKLHQHGIEMETKAFAAGFRIEHPQDLINQIQYGDFGQYCDRGKGKVPVADYHLASTDITKSMNEKDAIQRSCYSFCMCPGGQIMPTSISKDELCINGMSFSQRQSKWANAALVVNISPEDTIEVGGKSPLRGFLWQEFYEKKAAVLGGGELVAPVQRATDFMKGITHSIDTPISSSYRLGVKEAPCHEIYPEFITNTIRNALLDFNRQMPGFLCDEAILHGVETRTSSPIQIRRSKETFECLSMKGLFPIGEGPGHAGGIVSAAVDGIGCARAIAESCISKVKTTSKTLSKTAEI